MISKTIPAGLLCLLFFLPFPVFAHGLTEAPFFKVNGKYTNSYEVPTSSLSDFDLPEDAAPENYLVGKQVNFEVDKSRLPVPEDIVGKTDFRWDFGDGTTGSGLANVHTYAKPGSYVLKIGAKYQEDAHESELENMRINILPSADYKMPKAEIRINGKGSNDPLADILKIEYGRELTFDASFSEGNIKSFFWDLGDGNSASGKVVKHVYDKKLIQQQTFPVLRVTDENGFVADAFVEVDNKPQGTPGTTDNLKPRQNNGFFVIGAMTILGFGGVLFFLKKKRS